ncbi:hypothetical protein C8R46DRAFT_1038951 [Mycena filopes]|nr:hypothetical protein C8R46DRAFT_1038951 [Mycena filopes]
MYILAVYMNDGESLRRFADEPFTVEAASPTEWIRFQAAAYRFWRLILSTIEEALERTTPALLELDRVFRTGDRVQLDILRNARAAARIRPRLSPLKCDEDEFSIVWLGGVGTGEEA